LIPGDGQGGVQLPRVKMWTQEYTPRMEVEVVNPHIPMGTSDMKKEFDLNPSFSFADSAWGLL